MCGIVGILNQSKLTQEDHTFLRSANEVMSHRGTDGTGIWTNNQMGLGHRRLAIIDLEGGVQPMIDFTNRYVITYNGEIYNYKDLRNFLQSKGYTFRTKSDTEVILNAYANWGPQCVEFLNGIFAFGLWDSKDQSLFMARDHLGVKPLLYHMTNEVIIFASELKAILRHPSLIPEIDIFSLSDYLSLGYTLTPKTIIKNIHKLPPGSWFLWKDGQFRIQRYWNLENQIQDESLQFSSIDEAAEKLHAELNRAVEAQLVSDVPVGAFLSGGIDSSTIVEKMGSKYSQRIKTFSVGFQEKSYSELDYARLTANHLKTDHFEKVFNENINSLLPQIAWFFDEPFSDTSAIPTFHLCQFARRHVKVVLSGDGADECFAGYETYVADKLRNLYFHIPKVFHTFLISPLVKGLPSTHNKVSWDYKIKQFIQHAQLTPEQAHYSWRLIFSEDEKRKLLGEDVWEQLKGYTPFEVFQNYYNQVPKASPLNRSSYVDIKTWLTDAMLVKVDRSSMASSLEVRVPFLDYKLVEFALKLPSHFKLHGFKKKFVLKKAMKPYLPKQIIHRQKRGFNAPVAYWIKALSSQKFQNNASGLLQGINGVWENLEKEHKERRTDNGFKIWTLLAWQAWEKNVLEKYKH